MKRTAKLGVVAFALLVGGCATPYQYLPASDRDPAILFGDRSTDASADSLITHFSVSVNKSPINACGSYEKVGTSSGTPDTEPMATHVPANATVAIRSSYTRRSNYKMISCKPKPVLFHAEAGVTYSADVKEEDGRCILVLSEKRPADTAGQTPAETYTPVPHTRYLSECNSGKAAEPPMLSSPGQPAPAQAPVSTSPPASAGQDNDNGTPG